MSSEADAADLYRKAQAATLILLVKALLVSLHYFGSRAELEQEAALAIHEGKWPGGQTKLMDRLEKDFPHYFKGDGKLRAFDE